MSDGFFCACSGTLQTSRLFCLFKKKKEKKVQVECFQPHPQQAVSSKAPLAGGEIKASALASSPLLSPHLVSSLLGE